MKAIERSGAFKPSHSTPIHIYPGLPPNRNPSRADSSPLLAAASLQTSRLVPRQEHRSNIRYGRFKPFTTCLTSFSSPAGFHTTQAHVVYFHIHLHRCSLILHVPIMIICLHA